MPTFSPNGLSVNPGSVSGPSLVQGNVSTGAGNASVTIRGGGSAPLTPSSGASGLQAHPTVQGSPPVPQLSSAGTGARAAPTTTITSGGSVPNFGSGSNAPLPSGLQPNVLDLGTRTGGTASPSSSGLAKSAPLAGVGAGAAGGSSGVGLGTSVASAGAGAVGAVIVVGTGVGLAVGEGIRRGGLAAEESGLIPDTPIFEPYPPGWWERQPNENPAAVPVTTEGAPPFTGGQSPGVLYVVEFELDRTNYRYNNTFKTPGAVGNVVGPISQPVPSRSEYDSSAGKEVVKDYSWTTGSGQGLFHRVGSSLGINGIAIKNVYRSDGEPDTGGDPAPDSKVAPGTAPGSLPGHKPSGGLLPVGTPNISPGNSSSPGSGLAPAGSPGSGLAPAGSPGSGLAPAGSPGSGLAPAGSPGSTPGLQPPSSPGLQGSGGLGSSPGGSTGGSPSASGGTVSGSGNQPGLATGGSVSPSSSPARSPAPSQPGGCGSGCGAGLASGIAEANQKLDNLCNGSPQSNEEPDPEDCTLKEICEKLDFQADKLGLKSFPLSHSLLTGEGAGGQKDMVELIEWVTKNTDATSGKWPLEVKVLKPDGNSKTIQVKDQADAIHELFGLLFTVAEDADAAVNIAARGVVETIQTKVATIQSGKLLKAIKKFLGFNVKTIKDRVKISVSPKASGANGKLENQEMAEFLRPSEQLFESVEFSDSKELLIMLERILEDSEIARSALYKPLKRSKKGESNLTGEGIRREGGLSLQQVYEEEWDKFKNSLSKREIKVDEKKGGKDV